MRDVCLSRAQIVRVRVRTADEDARLDRASTTCIFWRILEAQYPLIRRARTRAFDVVVARLGAIKIVVKRAKDLPFTHARRHNPNARNSQSGIDIAKLLMSDHEPCGGKLVR